MYLGITLRISGLFWDESDVNFDQLCRRYEHVTCWSSRLEFTSEAYSTTLYDGDNKPVNLPGYRADACINCNIYWKCRGYWRIAHEKWWFCIGKMAIDFAIRGMREEEAWMWSLSATDPTTFCFTKRSFHSFTLSPIFDRLLLLIIITYYYYYDYHYYLLLLLRLLLLVQDGIAYPF